MLIGTGLPRRRWDILALFIVAAAILVVRSAASRDPAFDMPVPYAHPIIDGKHSLENQVKNEYMRATKTKCPTDNPRPTYFELKYVYPTCLDPLLGRTAPICCLIYFFCLTFLSAPSKSHRDPSTEQEASNCCGRVMLI